MEDWQRRISIKPGVCHGKPCIDGHRIMVWVVLDNLVAGLTAAEIAEEYGIEVEDVWAAVAYASSCLKARFERMPDLSDVADVADAVQA